LAPIAPVKNHKSNFAVKLLRQHSPEQNKLLKTETDVVLEMPIHFKFSGQINSWRFLPMNQNRDDKIKR